MSLRFLARVAGALVGVSSAWAQQDRPVLVFEYAGMGSMVVDARDQALANALKMLPTRVRELQREVPDFPPELGALADLVLTHVARPARVAIVYNEANNGGMFGYGAIMSILAAEQEDANALHATISGLLRQNGGGFPIQDCQRWPGMSEIQLPMGLVAFGPRETRDGWRYEVIAGTFGEPDAVFDSLPKGERGLSIVARASFNAHSLEPLMDFVEGMAGGNEQATSMIAQVRASGALGENGLRATLQAGYTDTHAISHMVVHNIGTLAQVMPVSKDPLSSDDFRAIPRDATMASIGRGDLSWLSELLAQAEQNPEAAEGLGQFEDLTGVDLRTDVIDTLGGTMGMYLSDSTGGGSLLSGVALVSFKDRARFMQAHGKLMAAANNLADQTPLGPGYIRLKGWKDGDIPLVSLRFNGLPVPMEPTYAFTERYLVLAMTPQAAVAAARQAVGKGDEGLGANPAFKETLPKKPVIAASFLDTRAFAGDGYACTTLVGSAIANAMRSPTDTSRDPGMVIPLYNDLLRGAKAQTEFTYWEGELLVTDSFGDRSMIVNAAGGLGLVGKFAPLVAIPALAAAADRGTMGWLDSIEAGDAFALVRPTPQRALWIGALLAADAAIEDAASRP